MRTRCGTIMVAAMAAVAVGSSGNALGKEMQAAVQRSDCPAEEVVETRNTSLELKRDDTGVWVLAYYGARLSNANDADAMSWSSYCGTSDLGTRKPVSYACFGTRNVKGYCNSFDKFGGLCVTHSDGCVTTDLVGDGVESIDEGDECSHLVLGLERGVRRDYIPALRLDGLDPMKRYQIMEVNSAGETHSSMLGKIVGGDALMHGGLRIVLHGDYDSAVFVLQGK